jgi:hypothetical protein
MKSMKLDRETKEMKEDCCISEQDYPYGLTISLEEPSIKKLEIGKLPEIGEKFLLKSIVEVTSISDNVNKDERNRCIRLQITDMELAEAPKEEKSSESVLYGA